MNDLNFDNRSEPGTYRAAQWISDDEQGEIVLTERAESGFSDDMLLRVGIGKAMADGIYDAMSNTGRFIVADWSE